VAFFAQVAGTILLQVAPAVSAGGVAATTVCAAAAGPVSLPARAVGIGRVTGMAVDRRGVLYLAAPDVRRVFRVDSTGVLAMVGDDRCGLVEPLGVALDLAGNLYVVDRGSRALLRVEPSTGRTTTLAGSSPSFDVARPGGIAVDPTGAAYVSDRLGHVVYRIDSSGTPTIVAGTRVPGYVGDGGPAVTARLAFPEGLAVDAHGGLYIADRGNHCIRLVDTRTGVITTVAGDGFFGDSGDGGKASAARLHDPVQVAVDEAGRLLIADMGNSRVRAVNRVTGVISAVSELGRLAAGAVAWGAGGAILVSDLGERAIRKFAPGRGIETIAGDGGLGYAGDGGPASDAYLVRPAGLARDKKGNVYVADPGSHRVRRIDAATGRISTVAGNGVRGSSPDGARADRASLAAPEGVAVDFDGRLLIADTGNHRVRRIEPDGSLVTVAGTGEDGIGTESTALGARLGSPTGLFVGPDRELILVQARLGLVHRIDPDGSIRRIAGRVGGPPLADGEAATSGAAGEIKASAVTSSSGDLLFIDERTQRLRRVVRRTGVVRAEAGRGIGGPGAVPGEAHAMPTDGVISVAGTPEGDILLGEISGIVRVVEAESRRVRTFPRSAQRFLPTSLLALEAGSLLIGDSLAGTVLRLSADGRAETVAGGGFGF
jgi:DNA-binding beta-propeller fold protein YncE